LFPLRDTTKSRRAPLVVLLLIAANVLVFVHQWTLGLDGTEELFARFALVPADVPFAWPAFLATPTRYATYLSSMFLHGGLLHLVGNLWSLWIFGDNVEDRLGHGRFLAFYLLCGLLAGAAHAAFHPASEVPTIGASGAISGVMGAYLFLFPRAKVLTVVPILFYPLFLELSAFVFLGLWFAAQLLSGMLELRETEAATGIAFLAHVGGFAAGALLHVFFRRREPVRGA
jgi:membrane associated rhomboid family serine protease